MSLPPLPLAPLQAGGALSQASLLPLAPLQAGGALSEASLPQAPLPQASLPNPLAARSAACCSFCSSCSRRLYAEPASAPPQNLDVDITKVAPLVHVEAVPLTEADGHEAHNLTRIGIAPPALGLAVAAGAFISNPGGVPKILRRPACIPWNVLLDLKILSL